MFRKIVSLNRLITYLEGMHYNDQSTGTKWCPQKTHNLLRPILNEDNYFDKCYKSYYATEVLTRSYLLSVGRGLIRIAWVELAHFLLPK